MHACTTPRKVNSKAWVETSWPRDAIDTVHCKTNHAATNHQRERSKWHGGECQPTGERFRSMDACAGLELIRAHRGPGWKCVLPTWMSCVHAWVCGGWGVRSKTLHNTRAPTAICGHALTFRSVRCAIVWAVKGHAMGGQTDVGGTKGKIEATLSTVTPHPPLG